MIGNRIVIMAALLCASVGWATGLANGRAWADEACKPVETAPGIKAIPAGCNALRANQQARTAAAKSRAAPAQPSVLFPGAAPGSISQFGGTEFRVNGQVRIDYGFSR